MPRVPRGRDARVLLADDSTGPPCASAIAPVASVEPSSTTTSSRSRYVCSSTDETAAPIVRSACNAGMTTETRGVTATILSYSSR